MSEEYLVHEMVELIGCVIKWTKRNKPLCN